MEKSLEVHQGQVGVFWYQGKPRGRVFYNPATKQFIVCVGSWINDHPEAVDVIVDEFGLENEDYEFSVQEHWELGMGYGD